MITYTRFSLYKNAVVLSVGILKLLLASSIVALTISPASAQLPQPIQHKVPKGYTIRIIAKGDLNDDRYEDYILVLKPDDEELYLEDEIIRKRILWIVCGRKNFAWDIVKQNTEAIYHLGFDANFPDCLVEISVAKGTFTIEHYGGFQNRWSRSTRFVYNSKRKDWLLASDTITTMDAMEPDGVLSEGQYDDGFNHGVSVERFNIYTHH